MSENIKQLLTERGYKYEPPNDGDSESTTAHYYKQNREPDVPDCLCNDHPPQFHITEHIILKSKGLPMDYHTFSIGICNESPNGWISFKFYAVTPEQLPERIDKLEKDLFAAWDVLFREENK